MTSEFAIAVHALVFLNHKAASLSSEELAKNVCTHPARIRKVMTKLKKAGLVITKEGYEGGYYFCKNASEVTLKEIDNALEIPIVAAHWHSGDINMDCMVASGMSVILDDIYAKLNETCKDELNKITIYDIDKKIFGKKL